MLSCDKCKKIFKSLNGFETHKKNTNCDNKCPICLKKYKTKQSLKRHESVVCKQKFECYECEKKYSTKYKLRDHKCVAKYLRLMKEKEDKENDKKDNRVFVPKDVQEMIDKMPNDKNIVIINNNNNTNYSNINNDNKVNNQLNIDNKVNNQLNIDNKVMKNNFFDTNPKHFGFDYKAIDVEEIKKLSDMNDYTEEFADMYMYEEEDFKKQQKDIIYKYDKEALQVRGMKMLFTKLQDDPVNRNVMVRKTKSGNCYVYEREWIEQKLQKIITKICNKLCDTLYDKETSMNHFIRLVLGSQPKRYIELRKHIEDEIINNKGKLIENLNQPMIE